MIKGFILLFVLIYLIACNKLTEKHYRTTDSSTGGFIDIRFDLNADKSINLIRVDQKLITVTETGNIYEPDSVFSIKGRWSIYKNNIRCEIRGSEKFIDSAFFRSEFKTKELVQNNNEIVFPITTDTLFIYGLPCVTPKAMNR